MSAFGDGFLDGVVLANIPVFVMANGEKGFATGDLLGLKAVGVGTVGDVVAMLFHPISKREFPEKKLAGPVGKGVLEDLGVLGVRPVEAYGDINGVRAAGISIEAMVVRPFVVGLPSIVTALKE